MEFFDYLVNNAPLKTSVMLNVAFNFERWIEAKDAITLITGWLYSVNYEKLKNEEYTAVLEILDMCSGHTLAGSETYPGLVPVNPRQNVKYITAPGPAQNTF